MKTFTTENARLIERVVELLRQSRSILFITGAGLSAESGLPTYRGIGGLYAGRDAEDDVPIEELLTGKTLETHPNLIWKHILQVEEASRAARPNRGHEVIAEMERVFERVWILTQNVDGFHQRAGSRNVIDIHGDVHRVRCTRCLYEQQVTDYAQFTEMPPRCPDCRSVLRPDVVLFGEQLPARQLMMYKVELPKGFDLVVSVGTTSIFPYISAPVLDAYHFRKPIVEINPGETDVSEFATVKLSLGAAGALDAIWSEYKGR